MKQAEYKEKASTSKPVEVFIKNESSLVKTFNLFAPKVNTWSGFDNIKKPETDYYKNTGNYVEWQEFFLKNEYKIGSIYIQVIKKEPLEDLSFLSSLFLRNTSIEALKTQTIFVEDFIKNNLQFDVAEIDCAARPVYLSATSGIKIDVPGETELHLTFYPFANEKQ